MRLTLDERVKLQVLLTAAGYWPAVPDAAFNTRLFNAILKFEVDNGFAPLAELVAATSWLPHTTRAALTGLRKRGYAVGIDRADKARGSVYRIEATERSDDSGAPDVPAARSCEAPNPPERTANLRTRRAG